MKVLIAVLLLCAGMVTGCGAFAAPTITMIGPWTGPEERTFLAVLGKFTTQTGIQVRYQGTRAVNQVLRADVQKGRAPDVAALSSPGELARYAQSNDLIALRDVATSEQEYGPQWQELLNLGTPERYAVPVKADLKSVVWFNAGALPGADPKTWPELQQLTRDLAGQGRTPWCLGLEANSTSGWPGTDWIEDILLRQAGLETYRRWAAGQLPWTSGVVRDAWLRWGELIAVPGAVRGGRTGALLTYFRDARKTMFDSEPGCLMEHLPSFAMGDYPPEDQGRFDFFPFPAASANSAFHVGVNLAGLFRDSEAARQLMTFLASREAQTIWPQLSGTAFSVNKLVRQGGLYANRPVSSRVATILAESELCLDASDVMPSELAEAFARGVLAYVADPNQLGEVLEGLDKIQSELSKKETAATERLTVSCG
ncbi:ABC transporter substrate-binding protein [Kibdelosporangium philippinense]|uniref:ABC transporter substrate-binding protein n=1 Tax=Kibdelosporangium philippinense TaxID=211113 RepID=A0ABS8ZR83_9PSEU|nr:ABC transporter substrate-binding protein [Kibdelosporangium philippinense]MCE7010220.1 ABC transporter substrate-binding protein [Kibdelosporangium philippinense]